MFGRKLDDSLHAVSDVVHQKKMSRTDNARGPRRKRLQEMLTASPSDLEEGVEDADMDVAADMGKLVDVALDVVTASQAPSAGTGAEPMTEPMFATTAWLSLTSTDTIPSLPIVIFLVSELTMVGEPSPLTS